MKIVWRTSASIAVGIGLLEAGSRAGALPATVLPPPSAIWLHIPSYLTNSLVWTSWGATARAWLLMTLLGLSAAFALSVATAAAARWLAIAAPWLSFVRAIPPVVLFPVALVTIGPGAPSIVVVGSLAAALFLFPPLAAANARLAERFSELALVLRLSRFAFLRMVVLPGLGLELIASARLAATVCLALTIAGEMLIGGSVGVGRLVFDAFERYDLEQAYATVGILGLLGILVDYVGSLLENSVRGLQ